MLVANIGWGARRLRPTFSVHFSDVLVDVGRRHWSTWPTFKPMSAANIVGPVLWNSSWCRWQTSAWVLECSCQRRPPTSAWVSENWMDNVSGQRQPTTANTQSVTLVLTNCKKGKRKTPKNEKSKKLGNIKIFYYLLYLEKCESHNLASAFHRSRTLDQYIRRLMPSPHKPLGLWDLGTALPLHRLTVLLYDTLHKIFEWECVSFHSCSNKFWRMHMSCYD